MSVDMPSPRRRSRVGALALIPLLLASASAGAEPLTRREAIEASLRSSPDIAGIRHRIEAARADVERVRVRSS
jgi:outer membrane protein TolC